MRTSHTWIAPVLFGLTSLSAAVSPAALASPADAGLRLIQTAGGHRAWMTQDEIAELARRSHAEGHCGGFMDVTEHPEKSPHSNKTFYFGLTDNRVPSHPAEVNRVIGDLKADNIVSHVRKLSSWQNRFLRADTGVQAAHWIRDEFLRMAKGRTDVTAELVNHKFIQPSVIIHVAGHGPNAAERVVLGAHEDSVNWSSGWPTPADLAPGADDNASGIATLLETFRALMDSGFRPNRSVDFIAYAGEEMGLLGSQDVAAKYKKDGIQVVGVMQLDMTLYPGSDGKLYMVNDHTDRSLTRFTEMLIDSYVQVPWAEMSCDYACSDHASWTDAGFPSTFPFEAGMDQHNPKIHTDKDRTELLTPSFGLHFAKLAAAFAVELASE